MTCRVDKVNQVDTLSLYPAQEFSGIFDMELIVFLGFENTGTDT